jgi:DNA polymerase III subunit beta
MNLTIAKDQLLGGLQSVQNVVSARTTLPILSNVLLRAEGERLELTATDLDVTITCSVEASVTKGGATTLPVKKVFGIARELGGQEIEMESDEKNVCSVRCGSRCVAWLQRSFRRHQSSRKRKKSFSRRKKFGAC